MSGSFWQGLRSKLLFSLPGKKVFKDRYQAGKLLAIKLRDDKGGRTIVLAIPRGGVPIGRVIADELKCSLDIIVTKKLGAPGQPELAIGAVGPEGACVLDSKLILELGIGEDYIDAEASEKTDEVVARIKKFRKNKSPLNVRGMSVILVDDGIATGATVEAAIRHLRKKKAERIILATPVAPVEVIARFKKIVDKLIIFYIPKVFKSVGSFYEYFPQLTDEEVVRLLHEK